MPRTSDEEQRRARELMLAREGGAAPPPAWPPPAAPSAPNREATAVGLARAAYARGDRHLEARMIRTSVDGSARFGRTEVSLVDEPGEPDLLGRIEDEGWTLRSVGYVFVPTTNQSTGRSFVSGDNVAVSGQIVGMYLFDRAARTPS